MHVTLPSDRISNMREKKKRSETGRRRREGADLSALHQRGKLLPRQFAPKINRRRKGRFHRVLQRRAWWGSPAAVKKGRQAIVTTGCRRGATLGGGYLSHDSPRRKCLYLDAFPAGFLRRLPSYSPSRTVSQRKRKRQGKKKGGRISPGRDEKVERIEKRRGIREKLHGGVKSTLNN